MKYCINKYYNCIDEGDEQCAYCAWYEAGSGTPHYPVLAVIDHSCNLDIIYLETVHNSYGSKFAFNHEGTSL